MNPLTSTTAQIQFLAGRFTEILKRIVEQSDFLPTVFGPFPNGGCRTSSRLFGFVLAEMSFPTTYVVGVHVKNPEREHAWLQFETPSGSGIIDLTCCQFDFCNLPCPYVAESAEWHNQHWKIDPQKKAGSFPVQNGMVPYLDLRNQILLELNTV